MRITIRQSDVDAMTEHARKLSPEEACGLIAGEDKTDGSREIRKVFFLTNTDHTNEHFTIDLREQLAAVRQMRAEGLKPLGNWHSHPETPSRPSEEDQRLANDSRASYLILSLAEPEHPVLNAFHIEGAQESKSIRKEDLVILPE